MLEVSPDDGLEICWKKMLQILKTAATLAMAKHDKQANVIYKDNNI